LETSVIVKEQLIRKIIDIIKAPVSERELENNIKEEIEKKFDELLYSLVRGARE